MNVRIGKNAIITFRINEQKGTAEDETEQYEVFVKFLVDEKIPFATARMAFVGRENDDSYWAVRISCEDYALIAKAYKMLEEEERG